MKLQVSVDINAEAEKIWSVLTDIDHSMNNITGIDKVEILERPERGLVGLKWRETRTMYGKEATEVMWITDAVENRSYKTRAESHGAVYISGFIIEPGKEGCRLYMRFQGEAQTFVAKVMNAVFSGMMKKSLKQTMLDDLEDIKRVAEG